MISTAIPRHFAAAAAAFATLISANAGTFTWLETNSTGGNDNWLLKGNYAEYPAPGNTGNFPVTNVDSFLFDAGTRSATINSSQTIGKLTVGANYGNVNVSQSGSSVLTLQSGGAGVTDAGIEVSSGRTTNTNIHVRLNLSGDIVFTNNGSARLRIGNNTNGNGGLQGSGTLDLRGGIILLPELVNHTYSGAVTVGNSATLQVNSGASFTSYSSLDVGATGNLTGGGTFAGANVHSGGRISPGGEGNVATSPATLTFTNLLTLQSTGLVTIDVRATGADAINATNGITLGGELRLRLNSDYTTSGTYQILSGLGGASGNFNTVNIRTEADSTTNVDLTDNGGGIWTGAFVGRGYDVTFDANSGLLTLTSIPEPSHILLSTLGVMTLLRRRR